MSRRLKAHNGDIIVLMRKWLGILLYIAIVCEMIFFPSWENLAGCAMALIVWIIFRAFFLKRKIILEHPFAFLMFISMFLYRYLPLIATLLEGYPITRGFEVSFDTFFYETILFIVSSIAFYLACMRSGNKKNNIIQEALYKMSFFTINQTIIWILGFIGLASRVYAITNTYNLEYGDVGGKLLTGFGYLQYAPILLLFPNLIGLKEDKHMNKFVWIYVAIIFVISFASNSRQAMLFPIMTFVLLFFFYLLRNKISIYKYFTPVKIVVFGFFIIFGLNFLSDISLAMLYTRNIRMDVNRSELLSKTMETLQNKTLMRNLRIAADEKNAGEVSYTEGWDETYIDNFMFNRYANMRITDRTLYYAEKAGYANPKMQENFFNFWILGRTIPMPVFHIIGVSFDKTEIEYSPGDYLYMLGTNSQALAIGYRVTSHVGDGLATFGWGYFLIQFVLFFLIFKLLDCLVYYFHGTMSYSIFGLLNLFFFFGFFRNAGGCGKELVYLLRGFWEGIITYGIIIFLLGFLIRKKKV
jgi:hypothetical protein